MPDLIVYVILLGLQKIVFFSFSLSFSVPSECNLDKSSQLPAKRLFLLHCQQEPWPRARLLGSGVLHRMSKKMSKKGPELLPALWEKVSFCFALVQVTAAGSWLWLHGAKSDNIAQSNEFGLV